MSRSALSRFLCIVAIAFAAACVACGGSSGGQQADAKNPDTGEAHDDGASPDLPPPDVPGEPETRDALQDRGTDTDPGVQETAAETTGGPDVVDASDPSDAGAHDHLGADAVIPPPEGAACAAVLACALPCGAGDAGCLEACTSPGDPFARARFEQLQACFGEPCSAEVGGGLGACVAAACPDPYAACLAADQPCICAGGELGLRTCDPAGVCGACDCVPRCADAYMCLRDAAFAGTAVGCLTGLSSAGAELGQALLDCAATQCAGAEMPVACVESSCAVEAEACLAHTGPACRPGESYPCSCNGPDGTYISSSQMCNETFSGFGPCACGSGCDYGDECP